MNLWILVAVAFLVGALFLPAVSFLVGPTLPRGIRDNLVKIWGKITLATGGSTIIVRRGDGHYDWLSVERNEDGAYKATIGGETVYFKDENGSMGSLMKEKFGVAYEGLDTVLDPALAKVGELHQSEVRADGGTAHGRWVYNDNGDRVSVNEYLQVPDGVQLVDMKTVMDIVRHGGDPGLARRQEERAKISQNRFGVSDKAIAGAMLLLAVGVGFGMGWFAFGGGSGAVPVPGLLIPGVI